jgi:hypothetical protein
MSFRNQNLIAEYKLGTPFYRWLSFLESKPAVNTRDDLTSKNLMREQHRTV